MLLRFEPEIRLELLPPKNLKPNLLDKFFQLSNSTSFSYGIFKDITRYPICLTYGFQEWLWNLSRFNSLIEPSPSLREVAISEPPDELCLVYAGIGEDCLQQGCDMHGFVLQKK